METYLGYYLKNYRTTNGISQEDFAFRIGISTRHYQYIEHGKVSINLSTIQKLAKGINLKVHELFYQIHDYSQTLVHN